MVFRDIDYNLRRLSNGSVPVKQGVDAIKQYIETLLLTRKGEKPFNVDFGTDIVDYLQESVNVLNAATIRDKIYIAISNFLRGVIINKDDVRIVVNTKTNSYDVSISYRENDLQERQNINIILKVFR